MYPFTIDQSSLLNGYTVLLKKTKKMFDQPHYNIETY